MPTNPHDTLSRRERQIMEIVYRLGKATANEVLDCLDDPPSYSAVRASLRILEEKGHLRHRQDGPRYVYLPTVSREKARASALRGLLRTFFDNSHEQLVSALLDDGDAAPTPDELDKLSRLIEQAREEGR